MEFDESGKIVLDHIYNKPDPRAYFSTLSKLDYSIPGEAEPVFRRIIEARRAAGGEADLSLLDLGCSYGVNAAILKHGLSMDDLYARYVGGQAAELDHDALIARDRAFYSSHLSDPSLEMTGMDVAGNAIDYAVDAHVLDGGLAVDLETTPLPETAAETVGGADIVISTGCIGYVKEQTLDKILSADTDNAPWMAHFVLRMFPYTDFDEMFEAHGYVTEKLPGTFRQRRFASAEEQAHALDNLAELDIDPTDKEADGWYHAEFHLSRPAYAARTMPIDMIFAG